MAKVTAPLFSLSASGTVGKTITFGSWRGINWVRERFIPANPQTAEQQNVRGALALVVEYFKNTLGASVKTDYNTEAEGRKYSGYNLFMRDAMDAYIDQLGATTTPVSLNVSGSAYPYTITWSDV